MAATGTVLTIEKVSSEKSYVVGVRGTNTAGNGELDPVGGGERRRRGRGGHGAGGPGQPDPGRGQPTARHRGRYTMPQGAQYVHTEVHWVATEGRAIGNWSGTKAEVFYDGAVNKYAITGLSAGVEYKARVIYSLNLDGELRQAKSDTVVFTTPPGAVASVTASRESAGIVASWDAVTGATGYDVVYSTDDETTWTRAATNQAGTTYTLTDADSTLAYVIGVRAVNSGGESAWTNSDTVPAGAPPLDVGSPTLTVTTDGAASWSYTVPEGAEYDYTEIRWRETAGQSDLNDWSDKENVVIWDSSVAAHAIADLTAGVEYKAKVFVGLKVNGENRYAKSNTVVFTTPAPAQPPDGVATVKASRKSGSIAAGWTGVTGATGYDVRYSADDGATWNRAATNQAETSYTLKGADDSLAYVVGVRAVNAAGESAWTNSATVPAEEEASAPVQAPNAVTNLSASRQNGGITVSWDAVDGATKYHITYSTDGKASWSLAAAEHTGNSITIANADGKLPYIVGVRAGNDVGWSGWVNSNEVPAVQQQSAQAPGKVTNLSASRDNGSITASWDAVDGATKYHVTYSTDGGASWSLAAAEHTTNSITIANADGNLPYVVGVRAGNAAGWSGWVNSSEVPTSSKQRQ